MQDLTTGSVTRHLLKTTSFMLVGMVFQTLYVLIDLYWVGRLGTVIYFYIQLRPPAPLVNTNPPPPQEQVVTAVEPARPAASVAASTNPSAIPGKSADTR